jgi:nudix-type nucleoside diphosphatase (YffH/AdpP family)
MKKVIIDNKTRIFDDFFKIEEAYLSYQKFDGTMSDAVRRLNFERGDSVAAVVLNVDTQQLILISQFRYPTYEKGPGWTNEIVAGMLTPGEEPEAEIKREILEEIGYQTNNLTYISTFYASPGGSSERFILYYTDITNQDKTESGGGIIEEGEDVEIVEIPLTEALIQMSNGQIVDAKTIIGLLWLQNKLLTEGGK